MDLKRRRRRREKILVTCSTLTQAENFFWIIIILPIHHFIIFSIVMIPKQAARSSPPPDQGSSPPASTSPGCPPSTQLWSVSLNVIWRESQKLNQIGNLHTAYSTVSKAQEWKEILKVQPTPVYISLSPGGQATRLPEGSGGWALSTSQIEDMKL